MPLPFLDTNVILRYLTRDVPEQAQRAYAILKQVEQGTLQVTTTEAVIVEVVQVLSSKKLYDRPRHEVQKHVSTVISFRGLKLPQKRAHLAALELYASTPRLSFVDALTVAKARQAGSSTVISFDAGFDRIQGISRREP